MPDKFHSSGFVKRYCNLAKLAKKPADKPLKCDSLLRILWVMKEGKAVFLSPNNFIEIPHWCFDEKEREIRIKELFELGYTALLIGLSKQTEEQTQISFDFINFQKVLNRFNIKLILNISTLKSSLDNFQNISLPEEALLFFESSSLSHLLTKEEAKNLLAKEKLLKEIEWIKNFAEKREVLFYINSKTPSDAKLQSKWMKDFCMDLPEGFSLVFSDRKGLPWEDHLPPNSFWDELSLSKESLGVPLIPIINAGGINQGSGLWPNFLKNAFCEFSELREKQCFKGVICLSSDIPKPGSFLDLSLLSASAFLQGYSVKALAENWLAAYGYCQEPKEFLKELERARELILNFSEAKAIAFEKEDEQTEKAFLLFKEIISKVNRLQKSVKEHVSDPKVMAYFNFFLKDVRLFVNANASLLKIPTRDLFEKEEKTSSFWSEVKQEDGVLRKDWKPAFLRKPNQTLDDPMAVAILKESRWI